MDELLTVARQLRPTALDDLGLRAAIAGQIEHLGGTGIDTEFDSEGDLSGIDPDTQLVIYRVSQESIGNAVPPQPGKPDQGRAEPGSLPGRADRARRRHRIQLRRSQLGTRSRWHVASGPFWSAANSMSSRDRVKGPPCGWSSRPGNRGRRNGRLSRCALSSRTTTASFAPGSGCCSSTRQPGLEVVAEAADGIEARDVVVSERPDLAILDVKMPGLTGLQATREIKAQVPDTAVLILSIRDDERYLFEALKAGASGYVLKSQADEELLEAIRAIEQGDPSSPPVPSSR